MPHPGTRIKLNVGDMLLVGYDIIGLPFGLPHLMPHQERESSQILSVILLRVGTTHFTESYVSSGNCHCDPLTPSYHIFVHSKSSILHLCNSIIYVFIGFWHDL